MFAERIRRLIEAVGKDLHEKEEVLRLTLLSALAGENTFLYGPPGTAKSLLARRIAYIFRDARYFEYLLGRFTTPEELFGPVSISRLKDADKFERVVDGFLPSAELVFLDEVWNASSPILNTLLTAINERRFRNGSEELLLPLRSVIGAAGELAPDGAGVRVLWDRFLMRLPVSPVRDSDAFIELVTSTNDLYADPVPVDEKITADELDEWSDKRDEIAIPQEVAALVLDIRERIARHNSMVSETGDGDPIEVSDRRWKQAARLLRTSALLNDRGEVYAIDCAILRHCLWSREEEIPIIETIVEEALKRYSSAGRFDPESLRRRLSTIRDELRRIGVTVRDEDREEAVEYRGEYYRIKDFVEDHLSLIWIGDFQNLSDDEDQETDLFFYGDDDDYAYSERFPVRRVSPHSLEVDGQAFHLETQTVRRTVEEKITIEKTDRDALTQRLDELRSEIADTLRRIAEGRRRDSDEAIRHLFVHRSYSDILETGMEEAERAFSLLDADIVEIVAGLE